MKIITHEDIKNLNIDLKEYYEWAREVFLNKEHYLLPPKISMKQENSTFINVMPSILKNIDSAGVKVVTRYPNRQPSLDSQIILYDSTTGKDLALMDANIITAYRTGAVAALAINTLSKKNYKNIAIIGLGNVCYATFNILFEMLEQKLEIKVMAYKGQEKQFIERYKKYSNLTFRIIDNYQDLIEDSDVIVSCVTSTKQNFGEDQWFKEGCLVVPVHTMGFQNCDLFFDKFIVDDLNHIKEFKYFDKFKETHEMAEVQHDMKLGRVSDKERIIAYNVGNSIFDIYFAKKLYDMLKKEELQEIDLKPPCEKVWI